MKILSLLLLAAGILHAAPPLFPIDDIVKDPPVVKAVNFAWNETKIKDLAYIALDQVKTFYQFDKININGKAIQLESRSIRMELTEGSHETRMNGVKVFLSESVRKQNGILYLSKLDLVTLVDPLMRPAHLQNAKRPKVVVLDAGHGGKDKGAGGLESKLTLSIVKLAKEQLEKKGYAVVLTREDDVNVPLKKRVAIANAQKNAVVYSLHFNSGPKAASGFETHVVSAREPNEWGKLSMALGVAAHSRNLLYLNNPKGNNFKILDRGIRHSKFRLLKDCKHPTVLIEAGFLTNPREAEKIQQVIYQETVAAAIARSVGVYSSSLGRKR